MDRATLFHAKSPIPRCTPSEITKLQRCERYLKHIATQTCRLLAHTSGSSWKLVAPRSITKNILKLEYLAVYGRASMGDYIDVSST